MNQLARPHYPPPPQPIPSPNPIDNAISWTIRRLQALRAARAASRQAHRQQGLRSQPQPSPWLVAAYRIALMALGIALASWMISLW